jgi:phage/conjugal plasmid C-4 type zinc finger TraR family protein
MLRELASDQGYRVLPGSGPARAIEALEAMRRIKDGTYGTCADCGGKIPAARLRAKPEATRCVRCQTERERQPAA